ncbi:hypothetical protein ABPG74_018469 [Tetrahymena malaccensis]
MFVLLFVFIQIIIIIKNFSQQLSLFIIKIFIMQKSLIFFLLAINFLGSIHTSKIDRPERNFMHQRIIYQFLIDSQNMNKTTSNCFMLYVYAWLDNIAFNKQLNSAPISDHDKIGIRIDFIKFFFPAIAVIPNEYKQIALCSEYTQLF